VFDKYIDDVYKAKPDDKYPSMKNISKMLLNSLLGRFGIDIYSTVTRTVDKHKLDHLETTRKVTNKEVIYNERFLVTYNPLLDKEKCKEFNLDIVKVHRR
jgi:hypothetical protein